MTGERQPDEGRAICDSSCLGYIAQNSRNWCSCESVIEHFLARTDAVSSESVAQILRAHKFPFALARRPLISLSTGERLQAALICLWQRKPVPELLVLDEPTNHLDFVGIVAMESVLAAWTGGLVVVSHDDEFLRAIGVERRLGLIGMVILNCKSGCRFFLQLFAAIDAVLATGQGVDPQAVACWVAIGAEAVRQPEVRSRYERLVREAVSDLTSLIHDVLVSEARETGQASGLAVGLLAACEGFVRLGAAAPHLVIPGSAAGLVRDMAVDLIEAQPVVP